MQGSFCAYLANKRWCYIVMLSLIGWVHPQNDPWKCCLWSDQSEHIYNNLGIILCMHPANERRCYIIMPSLISLASYTEWSPIFHSQRNILNLQSAVNIAPADGLTSWGTGHLLVDWWSNLRALKHRRLEMEECKIGLLLIWNFQLDGQFM